MISRQNSAGLLLFVSVFAMMASLIPPFSDLIALAANNITPYPGSDIQFDYFVAAGLGLLCGFVVLLAPIPSGIRPTVLICWTVKLAVALFIVPVFEYSYGFDIDGYFNFDSMPLRADSVGGVGTANVRVLAWLLFQVIGPSYHGGKVIFSFIGFIGIYIAYRGAAGFIREERPDLLLLMSLAPTSLFWSASLGKDPVALFGVGLYLYGGFAWLRDFKARHAICMLLGAGITSLIRSYFLPIMGIPLAIAFLLQRRRPVMRIIMLPAIAWAAAKSLKVFQGTLSVETFDSFMRYQASVASGWTGGSAFMLPVIDSPTKLVLVAPLALFTALFRPTLVEAHNAFALAAAIDNTVLLVLFFYATSRSRVREILQPELIWLATFIVMWGIMYGVGTGNLGAISRFKIQVLPAFIILLVYMARKRSPPVQERA